MTNLIHYIPVLFVVCLFIKKPYFSWLWLVNCFLLIATVVASHAEGLKQLILLNYTAVAPHNYFQLALLVALTFSALVCFKRINKLAALASYFIAYYALELLNTSTWTEFILHFELIAVFSALLIFSRNIYAAHKAAFSFILLQVFAASCLIAGSLIVHDNTLLHFKWGYNLPSYLILIGFLIQTAVFPFHFWFVNSQEKSCVNSNLLSHITLPLLSSFGLLQLFSGHPFLIYIGIISSLYAAIYLTFQNSLPAILSYLTLVFIGLIVCFIGLGTAFSTQAALFLILSACFSYLGYCAIIKNQTSDEKSICLFELQNTQQKLSPLNSILWIVFSISAVGVPFLGYGSKAISWFHYGLATEKSFTWLNYALAFTSIALLYSLILKPISLFKLKGLIKKWPLSRYIECLFAILILSLSIYTFINAPEDYRAVFSGYALQNITVLLGALPLFFAFKKALSIYSKQSPSDVFTKLKIPTITKDITKTKRLFYAPKIPTPKVKLFYFESIENSMSYVLVVFIICVVMFLWF